MSWRNSIDGPLTLTHRNRRGYETMLVIGISLLTPVLVSFYMSMGRTRGEARAAAQRTINQAGAAKTKAKKAS